MPAGTDEQAIADTAAKLSVHVEGVHRYSVRPHPTPALILGYGMLRDSAIAEGVKRLATVIERR